MVITGCHKCLNSPTGWVAQGLHFTEEETELQEVDRKVRATLRVGGGVKVQILSPRSEPSTPVLPALPPSNPFCFPGVGVPVRAI